MLKPKLQLAGFSFQELFQPDALLRLDANFLQYLGEQNEGLHLDLMAYRLNSKPFTPKQLSELLIECAKFLEIFIGNLLGISQALTEAQLKTLANDPIFLFKQWYVLREARRRLQKQEEYEDFNTLNNWLAQTLEDFRLIYANDCELAVAKLGQTLLGDQSQYQEQIERLIRWSVKALTEPAGRQFVKGWVSFQLPNRTDYYNLVSMQLAADDNLGRYQANHENLRHRDGFTLTDPRMSPRQALNEIHYCVYCHKNEGDFCSKGFPVKKGEPSLGLKTNPLGEILTGCPLEEKISEMHVLKRDGYTIAALAMIMVDNPMCPVTGHRICNDCMKSCIYQKQDPVNIPQVETNILTDTLDLPWGVEIYDLFTRWNPLRQQQWVAKPYNGLKVLIMGMGPAGFTLAHHLTMEGFAVVGADGLKIEPLPEEYVNEPIYSYDELKEGLDTRILAGFGGVAEYGITVRWDKNFLKLIYISLMRRPQFQVFGGVRFGGTITVEDAWELGFDHMAIAVGAGLPKELHIPGSMAPGMRQANDFLMALQLTGAAKKCSLANLQVRLPSVVIGGGLTGVDTATEVQAYYISQVEKTLDRYEKLVSAFGEARIREHFTNQTFAILNEFLTHGRKVREERVLANQEHRNPNFIKLIQAWGGVTIVYRRLLRESPAYTRNYEEVTKALEEGIFYAEGLEPSVARLDEFNHVGALVCRSRVLDENGHWVLSDEEHVIPAHSVFVATGAKPNIAYEFEHRGTFHREGSEYQTYTENEGKLAVIHPDGHCKVEKFGAFTSYEENGYRVTFLGDTHPIFHGSVVKAIASAKRTYPKILQSLGDRVSAIGSQKEYQAFAAKMNYLFNAFIKKIKRHTPSVIELEIQAPIAAKNFKPGQFYRVQNFERYAPLIGDTRLQSEGVAMIGAKVAKESGSISLMVLERGASTRLFATFKEGSPISIMGPTGIGSKIPKDQEIIMIIGGRLGAAHIRAVGPALRKAGNQVLYIAGFRTADEVYCQEELEAAADVIVWITSAGVPVTPHRSQDRSETGDFMNVLLRYAKGDLGISSQQLDLGVRRATFDPIEVCGGNKVSPEGPEIALQAVNRVHVIGSQHLVRMVQSARQGILKDYFMNNPIFIASIYGPMQCMLKGVCAQCLQWQIDPITGKRTKAVFACSWQDQPLDIVDLDNLDERLEQNRTQEILSNLWLDYLFVHYDIARI
jgi:NADPH-dependent glutamate synthase beta subunit-like oxidoreductase/NAD(P)H-flavin reductase